MGGDLPVVETPFLDFVVSLGLTAPLAKAAASLRAAVKQGLVIDTDQLRLMGSLEKAQIEFATLMADKADPRTSAMKVAIQISTLMNKFDTTIHIAQAALACYERNAPKADMFTDYMASIVTEVICAPANSDIAGPFFSVMAAAHASWAPIFRRLQAINTKQIELDEATDDDMHYMKFFEGYGRRFSTIRRILTDIKTVSKPASKPKSDMSKAIADLQNQSYAAASQRSEAASARKAQMMQKVDQEIRKLAPLAEERFVPKGLANTGASIAAPKENIVARMLGTCKERKAQLVAAQDNYERVSEEARDRYLELLKLRKEVAVLKSNSVKSAIKKQDGGGFMCPDSKFDAQIQRYNDMAKQVRADIESMNQDILKASAELKDAQVALGEAGELGDASDILIEAEVIAEQTTPDDEGTPYDPEPGARRVHFDFDKQDGGASHAGHSVTSMGLAFVTVAMAFVASMAMA